MSSNERDRRAIPQYLRSSTVNVGGITLSGSTLGFLCLGGIGLLLIVILVPLSLSYVEYYEYGLVHNKITGTVDTKVVYPGGRYFTGPTKNFLKYQADSHYERLDNLSVFSAGTSDKSIGLSFQVDVDFTYLLKEKDIGKLHEEMASSYRTVITSRAKDGIKNEAIYVTYSEFFKNRTHVEQRFKDAVQARWDTEPQVHCTLGQFHVGRIVIPDSVARQHLESKVQNERNDKESYIQQAQVERDITGVEVNRINLETDKLLSTVNAQADLLRSKAVVEARKITSDAYINGTKRLFDDTDIVEQKHKQGYAYIRALTEREDVQLDVSYLGRENVLKTRAVE